MWFGLVSLAVRQHDISFNSRYESPGGGYQAVQMYSLAQTNCSKTRQRFLRVMPIMIHSHSTYLINCPSDKGNIGQLTSVIGTDLRRDHGFELGVHG